MAERPIVPAVGKMTNCCGCCSLETGCIIIASIQLIGGTIVGLLLIAANILKYVAFQRLARLGYEYPQLEAIANIDLAVTLVLSFWVVVNVVLAVCLLSGTYRKKVSLLQVWMTGTIVVQLIRLALIIASFLNLAHVNIYGDIIGFLINLYTLWVVYSYKLEILATPQSNEYSMTAKV